MIRGFDNVTGSPLFLDYQNSSYKPRGTWLRREALRYREHEIAQPKQCLNIRRPGFKQAELMKPCDLPRGRNPSGFHAT